MGVHPRSFASPRERRPAFFARAARAARAARNAARPEVHYSRSIFHGRTVQRICKNSERMRASQQSTTGHHGCLLGDEGPEQWRRERIASLSRQSFVITSLLRTETGLGFANFPIQFARQEIDQPSARSRDPVSTLSGSEDEKPRRIASTYATVP